jgi:hypothetical protein
MVAVPAPPCTADAPALAPEFQLLELLHLLEERLSTCLPSMGATASSLTTCLRFRLVILVYLMTFPRTGSTMASRSMSGSTTL